MTRRVRVLFFVHPPVSRAARPAAAGSLAHTLLSHPPRSPTRSHSGRQGIGSRRHAHREALTGTLPTYPLSAPSAGYAFKSWIRFLP